MFIKHNYRKQSISAGLEKPEYRFLYDLNIRMTDPNFINTVRNSVQVLRRNRIAKGKDKLAFKLEQFGNNGGWAAVTIKELEKAIFDESKRPPDEFKGLWRSVEFEAIFTDEKAFQEFVSSIRVKGLSKLVTVKKDNSVRTDEDDKNALVKEVVVTYKAGDEDVLRYVCEQMDSPKLRQAQMARIGRDVGRAYVNNTCGLHVHFDMRVIPGATNAQEVEKQVKKYGERLARAVPALKMLLPKSRRQNQFCMNIINAMPPAGEKPLPTNVIDKERYTFINMKSYRRFETIEVRGHSGTLNADKTLNWIALCEIIMTSRIRHKGSESGQHDIRNPMDLIKLYKNHGLNEKLQAYINERFIQFNTAREREMFAIPAPRDAQPAVTFKAVTFDDFE